MSCTYYIFSKLVNIKLIGVCDAILINEHHGFQTGHFPVTNLCILFKQQIIKSFSKTT